VVPGERHSYRSSYSYTKGDPNAIPDPDYLYLLPYSHGTKQQLTQGNNGNFTHFNENQYAFDFDLPEGTPIHAARGGLVVEVKEDSRLGGPSPQFDTYGNFILIYHSDGTFGNYVHLRQNGALPKVGDLVEAGDLIGYSGNTGRSSGPHLHFDVRLPTPNGTMQSIPIRFMDIDGAPLDPTEGRYYYAAHPGKPSFPMVFGRDLGNDDFNNYLQEIKNSSKIEIRAERVDGTYILYAQNGSLKQVEMTYTLKLSNYQSSNPNPATVLIPPQSEIFLCVLQPINPAGEGSLQYSYRYQFK
jgi:murein DD-endopeptidase MepM/ murein hydrolase activator NlpD